MANSIVANISGRLAAVGREARAGNISFITRHLSDIGLPVAALAVVATLLVPLPTFVISALLLLSLAASTIILVRSLYISSAVQLTSYPAFLLLTTLLRLCLSLSVTRSILTTGSAGQVVEALGHITAGGNLIVGFVMFAIILVVQFIVVAKGAERVAEVGARFTLDAMPGKQMAIDADMRAGLISQEQGRALRAALQRESQLYGAMDGAMKFVKNDSVATIIIAFINAVAGLATGVLQHGMTIGEAGQKYIILTVGDGLAAIIPSLLIAFSAGNVVTRVATDDPEANVGADIGAQVFGDHRALAIGSGLFLTMMLIPGMPKLLLLLIGGGLAVVSYKVYRGARKQESEALAAEQRENQPGEELSMSFTVPLGIVVGSDLTPLIDSETESGARFRRDLPKLRSSIYYDLGVMIPNIFVTGNAVLAPNEYFIAIKEVPCARGTIKKDYLFVNDSAENIKVFGIEGEEVRNPADLKPASWIPASQRQLAELAGLKIWEPIEVLNLHLSLVLKRYAHEFVGIQEAQGFLDFVSKRMPKLVEEVVPKVVTIHQFTEVLQRLVQENISIRDLKSVLDALADWGRIEKDTVVLTEYVRCSLKRYISFRHAGRRDTLFVYLLDSEIEDVIRGAIRRTSAGSFLSLDPAISHDILEALRREITGVPPTAQKPVIITDMELRRFVRKMVELEFPTLSVLSYQELAPELNVQPMARISMRAPQQQPYPAAYNQAGQFNQQGQAGVGALTPTANG